MLPPRTDWAETIPPDEEQELIMLAEIVRDLQAKHARKAAIGRGLHYKAHAGVRAELRTRGDLPAPYAVGIFAGAGRYPAYVRYSSGAGRSQADHKGDVRGMALKVVGVPGKKLIPGLEDARATQDFLMIKTPTTPFRNAREFVRVLQVAVNPLQLIPTMVRLGPGRVLGILKQVLASLKVPVPSLATLRYWSALPTQWGAYAARTSLTPVASDGDGHGEGEHALRGDLAARLRAGPLQYTLSAQLYVDPQRTPIEDASVDWAESDSPYVPIADLVLPQQDLASEAGKRLDAYVDKLSFDPWHAPVEFRPLGNMMRARNHAYRLSVIARGASPEPDGSESFA